MKKLLHIFIITILTLSGLSAQDNLLKNSDMEIQGAWQINQGNPDIPYEVVFGSTANPPTDGTGGAMEVTFNASGATGEVEVFVYQEVVVQRGHTYKYSAAMKDGSNMISDAYIGVCWVSQKPVNGQPISETNLAQFGTWAEAAQAASFDGLIEASPAAGNPPSAYFRVAMPDTVDSDTIYFGINIGTWGTTADFNLSFDNITIADSGTSSIITEKIGVLPIYPNPSNGFVNIQSEEGNYVAFEVYNNAGMLVRSGILNGSKTIDLSDLKKGLYFINITSDLKNETHKFILK